MCENVKVVFIVLFVTFAGVAVVGEAMVHAVKCDTTKGNIRIAVNKEWSPLGAQRFLDLVDDGFFTKHALYRAVDNFLVQFGINADPAVQNKWANKGDIADDPNQFLKFRPGMVSFAGSGPNTRGTSMFVSTSTDEGQNLNFGTNPWETPFGYVTEGLQVVNSWYTGYGDMEEQGGDGPSQGQLEQRGNSVLKAFPLLDYINTCTREQATESDIATVDLKAFPKRPAPDDDTDDGIQVTLVNKHSHPLEVYWVNDEDTPPTKAHVHTIRAGETVVEYTYPGHKFAWYNEDLEEQEAVMETVIAKGQDVYFSRHTEL